MFYYICDTFILSNSHIYFLSNNKYLSETIIVNGEPLPQYLQK